MSKQESVNQPVQTDLATDEAAQLSLDDIMEALIHEREQIELLDSLTSDPDTEARLENRRKALEARTNIIVAQLYPDYAADPEEVRLSESDLPPDEGLAYLDGLIGRGLYHLIDPIKLPFLDSFPLDSVLLMLDNAYDSAIAQWETKRDNSDPSIGFRAEKPSEYSVDIDRVIAMLRKRKEEHIAKFI